MVIDVALVYETVPVKRVVTVRTKLELAVACPSLTVTPIVLVPLWPAAGVTVTVRFAPDPPNIILPIGDKVGLEEAALSVRLPAGVIVSPITKPIGPVELSSFRVWAGMAVMVGGVFSWVTVRRKLVLVEAEPSLTVTVMPTDPV